MVKKLYVNNKLVSLGDYTIKEVEEEPKYTIKCYYDQHDIDLTEYLNSDIYKFYTNIPRYLESLNIDDILTGEHKNMYDLVKHLNETDKENAYFIVYAMIHSGVSLSFSDFNDRWDSGVGGILCINRNNTTDVDLAAKSWIDDLNAILCGNVINYCVFDELDEIVDCCCGFINTDTNTTISCIYDSIPEEYGITEEAITKSMSNISD